ncbi:MAG TPA: metallophosphoesterase family protein [Clostridia bacterium]|nr:metallophosphoesterase family protein [Clostridia bacterium]
MYTEYKLDKAYEEAKHIPIDDSSRIVIFSDAHRGDGSFTDEFAPNENIFLHALQYYYDEGFSLIENGDSEDLWLNNDFKYIYYAHPDVYELIRKFHKQNRYTMIFGNHNIIMGKESYCQNHFWNVYDFNLGEEVPFLDGLVPVEAVRLGYRDFKEDVFILHGHQGDLINDEFWIGSRFLLRKLWRHLRSIGFRSPVSPARSEQKRHRVEKVYSKWIDENNQMTIIGHTHRPKFSHPGEIQYFNTGSATRPRRVQTIEILGGSIFLVEWRIRPTPLGVLQVKRRVVDGPKALSKYLKREPFKEEKNRIK